MDHVFSKDEVDQYAEFIPKISWLSHDHKPSENVDSFEDYALHRGWSPEKLQDLKEGRLGGLDTASLKPFLQSWLSIGLWEVALGTPLKKDDFIVSTDSGLLFTSEPLRQIIKDLETQFQSTPTDDPSKFRIMTRFNRVLKTASLWNRMLGDTHLFVKLNTDFCDDSYRSIMRLFTLMGATLQYTAEYLARWVSAPFRSQLQNSWPFTLDVEQDLSVRMIKRGWCPYIRTLLSPFGALVAEYAAIVGPPSTHFAHDSCSARGCVRHNIDESTYKPLHTQPGCHCQFVRPSLDQIEEILDSGGIPLVDFERIFETDEGKSIEVVPFEPGNSVFYAVSHVWSGGLGSLSEDGLPACTLDSLSNYMQPNADSKLVWIDSLCIPRERRLRRLSIHNINKVYSQAYATLVLDPELVRAKGASTRRMLLWITTAAWMQRMWTLPEGRLSKSPYFAFQNGAGLLQNLLGDGMKDFENPVTGALWPQLVGLFFQDANVLRHIHQSLCYRTTSKGDDEVPALAALFNIDTRRIFDAKSLDERMAIFWIALQEKVKIPMNILFLHGPKLKIPGLRWAPRSLLDAGRELSLIEPPEGVTSYDAHLSDTGILTATYVVIRLDKRTTLMLDKFNPINIAVIPEPGSTQVRVGQGTILIFDPKEYAGEEEMLLHDIDAFAVNVTNIEAKAGESLANELTAMTRTVLALTQGSLESGDMPEKSEHAFRARCLFQYSPMVTRGNELISGVVGWAQISIS